MWAIIAAAAAVIALVVFIIVKKKRSRKAMPESPLFNAEAPKTKFCQQCGADVEGSFCGYCGAKIDQHAR